MTMKTEFRSVQKDAKTVDGISEANMVQVEEDTEVHQHLATAAMDTDLFKDLPKARATQLIHPKDTVVHLNLNRVTEGLLPKAMFMASRLRHLKVIIKKVITVKVPLKGLEGASRNVIIVTSMTIAGIDHKRDFLNSGQSSSTSHTKSQCFLFDFRETIVRSGVYQ